MTIIHSKIHNSTKKNHKYLYKHNNKQKNNYTRKSKVYVGGDRFITITSIVDSLKKNSLDTDSIQYFFTEMGKLPNFHFLPKNSNNADYEKYQKYIEKINNSNLIVRFEDLKYDDYYFYDYNIPKQLQAIQPNKLIEILTQNINVKMPSNVVVSNNLLFNYSRFRELIVSFEPKEIYDKLMLKYSQENNKYISYNNFIQNKKFANDFNEEIIKQYCLIAGTISKFELCATDHTKTESAFNNNIYDILKNHNISNNKTTDLIKRINNLFGILTPTEQNEDIFIKHTRSRTRYTNKLGVYDIEYDITNRKILVKFRKLIEPEMSYEDLYRRNFTNTNEYLFDKKYVLKPLTKTELFIKYKTETPFGMFPELFYHPYDTNNNGEIKLQYFTLDKDENSPQDLLDCQTASFIVLNDLYDVANNKDYTENYKYTAYGYILNIIDEITMFGYASQFNSSYFRKTPMHKDIYQNIEQEDEYNKKFIERYTNIGTSPINNIKELKKSNINLFNERIDLENPTTYSAKTKGGLFNVNYYSNIELFYYFCFV